MYKFPYKESQYSEISAVLLISPHQALANIGKWTTKSALAVKNDGFGWCNVVQLDPGHTSDVSSVDE